jgi:hypothetical protein
MLKLSIRCPQDISSANQKKIMVESVRSSGLEWFFSWRWDFACLAARSNRIDETSKKIAESDSSSRSSDSKKTRVIIFPSGMYEDARYIKNKNTNGAFSAFLARFSHEGMCS